MSKMLISKVADPYASALLTLASSTNTLDTVTSDINDLLELFDSNENLVRSKYKIKPKSIWKMRMFCLWPLSASYS